MSFADAFKDFPEEIRGQYGCVHVSLKSQDLCNQGGSMGAIGSKPEEPPTARGMAFLG